MIKLAVLKLILSCVHQRVSNTPSQPRVCLIDVIQFCAFASTGMICNSLKHLIMSNYSCPVCIFSVLHMFDQMCPYFSIFLSLSPARDD